MRPSLRAAVTATIVAVAALSVTAPITLASTVWVAGGALGVGIRDGAWTYAVAGVLLMVTCALVITLWATVPGIARGRRRPAVIAVMALTVTALIVASRAWNVFVVPWLPRGIALGALVVAVIAAVVAAVRPPHVSGEPVRGVGPAVLGVVASYALVGAIVALSSTAIPQFPRLPWMAAVQGADVPGTAMEGRGAPDNPALASGAWSTIHNDSWMTDTYAGGALPDPEQATVTSFFAGGDCASLLWNADGNIVAVCVSPTEVRGFVLTPRSLDVLVETRLAAKPLAADALTNFSGGGYAILDAQQRVVTPLPGGVIARFDARTLELADSFDVAEHLQPDEGITSVIPAWSGLLWFVGRLGTVGLLDPLSGQVQSIPVGATGPVDIENSFAVIEGDGAYIVTGEALLRLDVEKATPVIRWRLPYDRGERLKPGQTSRASGTTPTVFRGGDFVAITDNAEPRMRVIVVDVRGQTPIEHCAIPVFEEGLSATENSLIALGDSLIVESNYGYSVTAVAGGYTTVPGLARIDVSDDGCTPVWTSTDVSIPSLVSKGVLADGSILTYTKEASALGIDAWWFTSVDAATGQVRWRRLAGVGPLLNNHYAAGYLGPDGSIYVGTISGVVALVSGA